MTYSPEAVSNALIDIANSRGIPLSNMALQKLLYFAHGWYLALADQPLVNEQFVAWKYGPVVESAYQAFRKFGSAPIAEHAFCFDAVPENSPDYNFLGSVLNKYGADPLRLMQISHEPGSPWEEYGRGEYFSRQIPDSRLKEYFSEKRRRGTA